MGANRDADLFGELHRLAHVIEVGAMEGAMEAAGDVGRIDRAHEFVISAEGIDAEAFAHVAV